MSLIGISQSNSEILEWEKSLESNDHELHLTHSIELLENYLESGEYLKAEEITNQSLRHYLLSNNDTLKAQFAFNAGDAYHYRSKFQLAVQYFKDSYRHYTAIHDHTNVAEAAIGLLETYKFLKELDMSVKYGYKAVAIYDSLGLVRDAMDAKTLLSGSLIELRELSSARNLLKEVLNFYKEEKNELFIAIVMEDFAYLNFYEGNYSKAFEMGKSALALFQKIPDIDGVITSSQLLSEVYLHEKDYQKALEYAQNSVSIIEELEDKRGLHDGHLTLGNIYLNMGQMEASLEHLNLFLKIGKEVEDPTTELRHALLMIDWYKKNGDLENALKSSETHRNLSDSINYIQQQEFVAEMNARYAIGENEKALNLERSKNQLLEKDGAIQRANRNLIIILLSALMIILILLVNRYRLGQKRNRELLEKEISANTLELKHFTSGMLEKNKLIQSFEEQLNELSKLNDNQEKEQQDKLKQLYQLKILTDEDWSRFQQLYREVYPNFIESIKKIDENLSEGDIRHLLLVKLSMSTREISEVLGISVSSVRVGRHRLRKRLNIGEDINLKDILDAM